MKLAAIDIGSNSIHMLVARADDDGVLETIDREKDMVRLGADTFREGRLSPRAVAAGVDTLAKFAKIIAAHKPRQTEVVATSAVREAANGKEFLDAVRKRTGLSPRVISGREEARLIHAAVRASLDLAGRRALCLDIGGGSVELALGDAARLRAWASLPLGVQRLRDIAPSADALSRTELRRIEREIRRQSRDAVRAMGRSGFQTCVGTSGTILNLGLAAHLSRGNERWISPHGRVVSHGELAQLVAELLDMPCGQRQRVPGIDSDRADTIHLGGLLLVRLMESLRADAITLCDAGVREGLVIEAMQRAALRRARPLSTDLRRTSVMGLLRRCGQDDAHSRLIAKISLSVFDATRRAHKLGGDERRLLEFAALMHDVGRHISFERHEQHSHYLIRHGDLLGFTNEEIDLMAIIARFHRRAKPRPRHREFAALTPRTQRFVTLAAGILRLAEGLDRRHAQVVRGVRCRLGSRKLQVLATVRGDAEVELWSAARKNALLERALERRVTVERG